MKKKFIAVVAALAAMIDTRREMQRAAVERENHAQPQKEGSLSKAAFRSWRQKRRYATVNTTRECSRRVRQMERARAKARGYVEASAVELRDLGRRRGLERFRCR